MSSNGTCTTTAFQEIRPLRQHHAREQTAVRATANAEVSGTRHATLDQILRNRNEIVIRDLPVFLQRRLVPARSILPATADIGNGIRASASQPAMANNWAVAGSQADLESAVPIEQRRSVSACLESGRKYQKVRHFRAIRTRGEALFNGDSIRVEELRQGLQRLDAGATIVRDIQRVGRQEILERKEHGVRRVRGGDQPDAAERFGIDVLRHPLAILQFIANHPAGHVLKNVEKQVIARGHHSAVQQRCSRRRLIDRVQVPVRPAGTSRNPPQSAILARTSRRPRSSRTSAPRASDR